MKKSKWDWWGDTGESRNNIIGLRISLIIAVIIIMILVMTFGSTIGSHNTADYGGKTQQTEKLDEENEELLVVAESVEQAAFGAVPYFDEDANGMLQYADGWLYGYLGGSVFRMDADTGELSVLFETAGTRSLHFCIDNGFLYFLTIPQVTFVDGTKAGQNTNALKRIQLAAHQA